MFLVTNGVTKGVTTWTAGPIRRPGAVRAVEQMPLLREWVGEAVQAQPRFLNHELAARLHPVPHRRELLRIGATERPTRNGDDIHFGP